MILLGFSSQGRCKRWVSPSSFILSSSLGPSMACWAPQPACVRGGSGQQGEVAAPAASFLINLLFLVRALRRDACIPLSKSSASLMAPNPSWVNPSRAGGTSAGSAPHRAVQACTPARNPPLSPVLCQDVCLLIIAMQPAFAGFPQECFCWALSSHSPCLPQRAVSAPWAVPLHSCVAQQGGGELLLPFPSTVAAVLENKALAALHQ